jgi:ribosomal protein L37AE/L43A
MADKRKRSSGDSGSSQERSNRANRASTRHQALDGSGRAQDAGMVANKTCYFPLEHIMGSSGNSLWPFAGAILENLDRQDYDNLRSTGKGLSSSLPVPQLGQPVPGPVKVLGHDCQNIQTFPPSPVRPNYYSHIPFPCTLRPYPGGRCTRKHLNDRSGPILRCAGVQHKLPFAVGIDGHGHDFWVCGGCANQSYYAYCLPKFLPHHEIMICAPCAVALRTKNGDRLCDCTFKYEPNPTTGAFWFCTACREDFAEGQYNIVFAAAQKLQKIHDSVPADSEYPHPISIYVDP